MNHPTWDAILDRLGKNIGDGSGCGGDYLCRWIACAIRYPFERLPYLFLYGPMGSGKSTFHEALSVLVPDKVVDVSRLLEGSADFDPKDAIFGYIDRGHFQPSQTDAEQLLAWTRSPLLHVRHGGRVQASINNLHFVQCAESLDECPALDDSRLTIVPVSDLGREAPKTILLRQLKDERAAFLETVKSLALPLQGRYRLPALPVQV